MCDYWRFCASLSMQNLWLYKAYEVLSTVGVQSVYTNTRAHARTGGRRGATAGRARLKEGRLLGLGGHPD
eukprot:1319919-Pleurochrysis_carterae.AAC.1